MNPQELRVLADRLVSDGAPVSRTEALGLLDAPPEDLVEEASRIRRAFSGRSVQLCAIVPYASGVCGEDCAFCAQSRRRAGGDLGEMGEEEVLEAARRAREGGARFFSLVLAGRAPGEGIFQRLLERIRRLRRETDLDLCASPGLVDAAQARGLAEAGLRRFHGNLETGRGFFPRVCTTHRFEDKLRALETARAAGLEVCSGGLLGMGESWADRLNTLKVPGATVFDAALRYKKNGWEGALNVTNLFDEQYYSTLGTRASATPGQLGYSLPFAGVGAPRTIMASLRYSF